MTRRLARALLLLSDALRDLAERAYPTRVQLREVTRYEVDGSVVVPWEEYTRALTPADAAWIIRLTKWRAVTAKEQARA